MNGSLELCGLSCNDYLDFFPPPPDLILSMPPPPVPPSLQQALLSISDVSYENKEKCNFCEVFQKNLEHGSGFIKPETDLKSNDSWLSLLVASILGSTLFGALLIFFLIKCKKWKIFPITDSCPILPGSFLRGHKNVSPPCTPTDSCISPVVNEKSPQSIITNSKKGSITTKYWKNTNNLSTDNSGHIINDPYLLHPGAPRISRYDDEASCTSSPVYAELDVNGVNTQDPTPVLITGPSESISPYAVHTYSEVPDGLRMVALGSSSTLLPDASHRLGNMGPIGSAAPLLSAHINGTSHLNYLTGRPMKKSRALNVHQMHRNRKMMKSEENLDSFGYGNYPKNNKTGLYSGVPNYSPNCTTLRAAKFPYNVKDSKRPLPPVPGVHL